MEIDLTKPIEPLPGAWSPMPIAIKYFDKTIRGGYCWVWFKVEYENGDEYYNAVTGNGISEFVRNVRTLAERCKEELKGAKEVLIWGNDVGRQGAKCTVYTRGGIDYVATGFLQGDICKLMDNFMLERKSVYVTPVTWTPKEAQALAEELEL